MAPSSRTVCRPGEHSWHGNSVPDHANGLWTDCLFPNKPALRTRCSSAGCNRCRSSMPGRCSSIGCNRSRYNHSCCHLNNIQNSFGRSSRYRRSNPYRLPVDRVCSCSMDHMSALRTRHMNLNTHPVHSTRVDIRRPAALRIRQSALCQVGKMRDARLPATGHSCEPHRRCSDLLMLDQKVEQHHLQH